MKCFPAKLSLAPSALANFTSPLGKEGALKKGAFLSAILRLLAFQCILVTLETKKMSYGNLRVFPAISFTRAFGARKLGSHSRRRARNGTFFEYLCVDCG